MTTQIKAGELVSDLSCYGWPEGRTLDADERAAIVDYASWFEECDSTREELQAMDDKALVETAYSAMADYARGQM